MQQLTTNRRNASLPRTLPSGQAGVTLVELLVVVVLAVILMSIGVPSYKYVTNSNRLATEVNTLLGDLQYARSEATREGQYVTVCVAQSTSPATCAASGTATWQNGWIIFSDVHHDQTVDSGDAVLRIQNPFTSSDTFVANPAASSVTFNRDGFASLGSGATRITLNDSASDPTFARCLDVNQAGMMSTQTHTSDVTCT
ncbi:MAG TPA: GspH/FimT family protein [Propionibacteriaceae bacterium]|nr:GspH/FimT family protein [Propionibacteriaceae bacterium]